MGQNSTQQTTTGANGAKTNRVDQFFLVMSAHYPYRWAGSFSDVDAIRVAKAEWGKVLSDFSDERIKIGLERCKLSGNAFPPSIPEFVKMCLPTPEELGILSEERAYQNFLDNKLDNPLLKATVGKLDMFRMQELWAKDSRREFLRVYRLCVEDFIEENSAISIAHNPTAKVLKLTRHA